MICPAFLELINDDAVRDHPTALRVYVQLARNPLIYVKPHDVKAWLMADDLHTHRDRIADAFRLLIARGYALEIERGSNNIRRLQLLIERGACHPNEAAPSAA